MEGGDRRAAGVLAPRHPRQAGSGLAGGCRHPLARFVVHSTHRLVKARKVCSAHRRLRVRLAAYHAGEISAGELEASIQGWINHVRHADSWGLRVRVRR
ncbi:hypothetical protein DF3PB_4120001 [uncultured Defluviicoccus sp.]|uniref:Uncharacterized protein n=1 Tax=metagenome TaxID=256318 RepID=A0A380TFS5_9ZZZZ|nr:hypothetical protein DF3PB_4120001 [uncultured Defluviicoccus sp.]